MSELDREQAGTTEDKTDDTEIPDDELKQQPWQLRRQAKVP